MLKFIILGAVQGLTEFLPVSSSAHLTITQHFLGINKDIIFLDIALHIGTILALLIFFFKDICSVIKKPKMLAYIFTATIITGIIGLSFKKIFESFFNSLTYVGIFLIINSLILFSTKFFKNRQRSPVLKDALYFGFAQGLAIAPGISRSGLTMTTLLFRGIKKEEAFRFSFIASIPAVLGAFLIELKDTVNMPAFDIRDIGIGIITSCVFGLLALFCLNKIIINNKFHLFGYYCLAVGLTVLFLFR